MTNNFKTALIVTFCFLIQGCSSSKTKVTGAWKAEQEVVDLFKDKNVFVLARTASDHSRIALEETIAIQLRAKGIKATESFKKFPKIYPNREITEDRVAIIKNMLASEGFNAVIVTAIKDKEESTTVSHNSVYMGASYGNYYPGYYGNFYNYYAYPYANGPYYSSFGGHMPISTSTSTTTTYVLETVAYNLDEPEDKQLVAVVTSSIRNPKDVYKIAADYADKMMKSLQKAQ